MEGRKRQKERKEKKRKRQKENETMNDSSLQLTDTICERKFRNFRKKTKTGVKWKEENERKKKTNQKQTEITRNTE